MKKLLYLCAAVLFTLSALPAFAATVTGTWSAEMKSPDGNSFQLTFTFKQDDTKLTGTVAGPQGDPLAITEGTVTGDKLSFKVSFNGTTITHEGTIAADQINLSTKSDNPDFPGGNMVLKRAK
jgi:hypothetical protein